eukprot:TRINITY_DN23489_c0_g1_i1.p1 TRINITY_DN23489_c0_g1~~TRINITY_DN23489_c0_g1_i1.p1  ORF type:complete len:600 (-),score=134.36 TRINITY_DN23489_c0_g1_i1:102-1901(-)
MASSFRLQPARRCAQLSADATHVAPNFSDEEDGGSVRLLVRRHDASGRLMWLRRTVTALGFSAAVILGAFAGASSRLRRADKVPLGFAAVGGETGIDALVSAAAEGDSSSGYEQECFESGVDLKGYDVDTFSSGGAKSAPSAAACKQRCEATEGCKWFTWDTDGENLCFLKTSDAGRRSWGKRISGPRVCASTVPAFAAPVPEVAAAAATLAGQGLCNASMALTQVDGPRAFDLPPDVLAWCQSDALRPPGAWNWPGRNWCWLNTKIPACYASSDDNSLPNWWWSQEAAAKRKLPLAPEPTKHLLAGMLNPTLCDMPQHGAPLQDISPQEAAEAHAWVKANLNIYIINLPFATDRWKVMEKRWADLGFTPNRIEGIVLNKPNSIAEAKKKGLIPDYWDFDMAKKNVKDLMSLSDKQGQKIFYDAMGIGTVGCAAAHLHAQRVAARRAEEERKPLALVMEDDVWVQDDFAVRLRRLLTQEAPCDWAAISLTSRCSYGFCVSPHLSRVEPDGNEPNARCHTGTNFGMYGTLYRASEIPKIQRELMPVMWNNTHSGCLPIDIAMAAISDRMAYYAVPSTQRPGFMYEMTADFAKSNRRAINR